MSSTGGLGGLLGGDPTDALVHLGGVTTSRAELESLADELAAALRAAHLDGAAVGVLMPNVPATIAAWFGIWRAGGSVVPLNPRVPASEIERLVESTGLRAVVSPAAGPSATYDVEPRAPAEARVVAPGEAILQLTSGTTGAPKPVVLHHDTVLELLDSVIATLRGPRATERARMPNLVPMSLALWGGIYQVLFAFRLGVPAVLMSTFEPREFARLVLQHGIRSSVLPPAALVMLLEDPSIDSLAPLRYVRSVSAPLSPVHARRFHERFGIAVLNGYGQTELGGEAVGWSAADWRRFGGQKLGSVGRPHQAFRLRVRTDAAVIGATDEIGELEIRADPGPARDDPALAGRITDDGWLRTGDLARIDGDGFVWIEGRVSSMINRGGLKVFPAEVEEHLRALPGVHDVAVVGVADDRLGEIPWAFAVAKAGAHLDPGELRQRARDAMAPYKVPAGVTLVDALPRNESGKVLAHELAVLADRLRAGELEAGELPGGEARSTQ